MHTSFSQQPSGVYSRRMTQVSHFPLAAPELVDRERELSYVTRQLAGDSRLVTLVGPAGVGKTHLAIHIALRLQDTFERVAFVDLTPKTDLTSRAALATPHAQQFMETLLKTSGLDSAHLVQELAAHKTLLVLDSFETVLEAASSLSELLAHCPTLSVLVTSRSPLGLRFETFTELHPFTPSSAFNFFVSCAKATNPPYALGPYQEAIQHLCKRLDGLPLALELAAAHMSHMTPQALLAHLDTHPSLPHLALPDRPERHQNLGVMVNSGVSLLSTQEQTFFCRLGVMAGSFTAETAKAVTDADQLGLETLGTLIKLRNYGLLVGELTTPPRFKLLKTTKAVAYETLSTSTTSVSNIVDEPSELYATRTRQLQHYLSVATHYAERLRGADVLSGLQFFLEEQENLSAALTWSSTGDDPASRELGVSLAIATYGFWQLRGQSTVAHTWLETFRGTYPAPLHAAWLWAFASSKLFLDHNQEAIALAKESLGIAKSLKDKTLVLKNQIVLTSAHRKLDHLEKALELGKETHKLAKELGAPDFTATVLNALALTYAHLGQPEEAKQLLNEALCVAKSSGNILWQALTMSNLGLTTSYEERISLLQESLTLLKQLGDEKRLTIIYVNLTDTYYHLGRYEEAQSFAEEGLLIAQKAQDRLHIGLNFNNLGLLARERGDIPKAEQYFSEALERFRELGVRSDEAEVMTDWARCYHHEPERAAKQHLAALAIALESKNCVSIMSCLDGLADLEVLAGRYMEAVLVWSVAKKLWEHDTAPPHITEDLFEQTKWHLDQETLALVLQKGAVLSPQQLFYDLCKAWNVPCQRKIMDVLSVRQQDILKLVAQGYSSKKIAKVFGLSEPTVKYHLKEVFDKLGVNSRAEAVTQAHQRGLL
jgi:predicted ATPase/DNA-binding CsgD family transcriptional regulator